MNFYGTAINTRGGAHQQVVLVPTAAGYAGTEAQSLVSACVRTDVRLTWGTGRTRAETFIVPTRPSTGSLPGSNRLTCGSAPDPDGSSQTQTCSRQRSGRHPRELTSAPACCHGNRLARCLITVLGSLKCVNVASTKRV